MTFGTDHIENGTHRTNNSSSVNAQTFSAKLPAMGRKLLKLILIYFHCTNWNETVVTPWSQILYRLKLSLHGQRLSFFQNGNFHKKKRCNKNVYPLFVWMQLLANFM